jgi:hypothetical protein
MTPEFWRAKAVAACLDVGSKFCRLGSVEGDRQAATCAHLAAVVQSTSYVPGSWPDALLSEASRICHHHAAMALNPSRTDLRYPERGETYYAAMLCQRAVSSVYGAWKPEAVTSGG